MAIAKKPKVNRSENINSQDVNNWSSRGYIYQNLFDFILINLIIIVID